MLGLGGIIGPPLITWLIYTYSWREAFLLVGMVVFVLIILGAQFLRQDPSKMGQVPYGQGSETRVKAPSIVLGIKFKTSPSHKEILALCYYGLLLWFLRLDDYGSYRALCY